MGTTKAMLLDYLNIIEDELRKGLQEVVDDDQEVELGPLADLITAAVIERMHPGVMPNIAAIREQVRDLFDPSMFDDGEGPNPLAALAAIRAHIAKND